MLEPIPDDSATVTRLQLFRTASRVVAAYLLLWAVTDLIALPREFLTLAHELHNAALAGASWSAFAAPYWLRVAVVDLTSNVLRILLWLIAAGWFFRCGPRIQKFFSDDHVG